MLTAKNSLQLLYAVCEGSKGARAGSNPGKTPPLPHISDRERMRARWIQEMSYALAVSIFATIAASSASRTKIVFCTSMSYVIGKTGAGKSTLIETMALQDLERGNGFALIDPHGDLVARVAARVPASQKDKVIYLNATDPAQPYGYNPLRHVGEDRIALAASGMMDVFKKMRPDAWGVRMEHILRNVLMALLEQPMSR